MAGASSGDDHADARPIRVLVANDDGIEAPGLKAIVHALVARGRDVYDVRVCAPNADMSAKSHSITVHEALHADEHRYEKAADAALADVVAHSHTGTPVDSVRLAFALWPAWRPDVVVSGINKGNNVARNAFYSGTVAVAREGWLQDITSLAFSLDFPDTWPSRADQWPFADAAAFCEPLVLAEWRRYRDDGRVRCTSVNLPNREAQHVAFKGLRDAALGESHFSGKLNELSGDAAASSLHREGRRSFMPSGQFHVTDTSDDADALLLSKGFCTRTVLHERDTRAVARSKSTRS
mmetsp:Transcript_35512/g.86854  ORF Transcript_35512/g.86854 Transcript_35512/m.86854 type:complete len:294 (-) Transcript_35512:63-944(-)|eukprot:CAMPEP_0198313856 /NCGR_PEP_ID=MMETSP1450-20131203/4740_1 /TAXON_ID=753684 ORGANISM="Madagascaria erythrocladiodes, Strain CCMP3234" /NCGR_SAMPLE_ID=MMETSP1450 /ASSEMBLY_ACC=CAM_ASM_001115 /LENGTH=293 /DNA_ID=CAMNT_0044016877 /DNA_START=23 /DNA_END=904 /DNA_ORIENTATION=+